MDPWGKQEQIVEDLLKHRFVTVVSCNGAGKSTLAAWITTYFQECHPNCQTWIVAPTTAQIWGVTWRRLRHTHGTSKRPLHGEMLMKRWEHGPQWYATGISTDKEEQFQGIHATDAKSPLFVLVDEASGVKPYVFDAISGWLTTPNCYVLLIGNGNKSEGPFFESHHRGPYVRHSISAFDVPRHIIPMSWIDMMREQHGEDSPQWEVRVKGTFPKKGADWQLIPEWLLQQAAEARPTAKSEGVHMGVDVARSGSDNNVAIRTNNGVVDNIHFWQTNDTMVTAEKVAMLKTEWNIPMGNCHIEEDGIGGAVVDRLREAGHEVDAVKSGGEPTGEHMEYTGDMKFGYRKAELAFAARQMMFRGEAVIPNTGEFSNLWKDVQRINYEMDGKGRTVLEAKKKLRARTGISPDFADAWFVSFSRQGSMTRLFFI